MIYIHPVNGLITINKSGGAGVHGEVSHLEDPWRIQASWGLQGSLYYGIGNNSGNRALDGSTASMVNWEMWLPSLGRFGHFDFGDGYDVSSKGIRKSQLEKIKSILENSSNPEDVAVVERLEALLKDNDEKIKTTDFLRIGRALRRNGFELVDRMGDHNDRSKKYTFRKTGSLEYGNIEFMSQVWKNEAYCSYNYGNNFITHFLIDYLGWKGRGY